MKINRTNYESYFLDYLEGNLSAELQAELMKFLAGNPDLKTELNEFEPVALRPEPIVFERKASLKKNVAVFRINAQNFNDFCVAKLEGDLTEADAQEFELYLLSFPEKQSEFELFQKTKLVADSQIVYPKKAKLKRAGIIFTAKRNKAAWLYTTLAMAASLMLFFWLIFKQLPEQSDNKILSNNDSVAIPNFNKNTQNKENQAVAQTEIPTLNNDSVAIPNFNKNTQTKANQAVAQTEIPTLNNDSVSIPNFNKNTQTKANQAVAQTEIPTLNNDSVAIPNFNKNTQKVAENKPNTNYFNPILPENLSSKRDSALRADNQMLVQNTPSIKKESENKEYLTVKELLTQKVREALITGENKKRKVGFWDVAQATVNGLAKLTGAKMKLKSKYDDNGNLKALAFESKSFGFEKEIGEK